MSRILWKKLKTIRTINHVQKAAAVIQRSLNAGAGLYLDGHAIGVGAKGGSGGAGVGDGVGAGFADVNL